MDVTTELLSALGKELCDYEQCRQLIRELGGSTVTIMGHHGLETTPLHEVINYGHYDFALELIREKDIDANVLTFWQTPLIWDLQYLDEETTEARWEESKNKLRILRALIRAGADPNPVCEGETFRHYVGYAANNGEGDYPQHWHYWTIEHIVEAYAEAETDRFLHKLKVQ